MGPRGKKLRKAEKWLHSFVLQAPKETWDDAACKPIIDLINAMRTILASPKESWMGSWNPLSTYQHGDLNSANILVDVHDGLWLIDFAKSDDCYGFHDAAKMISTILFEYYPIPWAFGEVQKSSMDKLCDGLGLKEEQAELLLEMAKASKTLEELEGKIAAMDDERFKGKVDSQISSEEHAAERMGEACAIIDTIMAPLENGNVPELWQMACRTPPEEWEDHTKQAFRLCVELIELSSALVSKASQRAQANAGVSTGGPHPGDLHVSNLMLPLLLRGISSVRYIDMSIMKKRVAWHTVLKCAEVLAEALPRKPLQPPKNASGAVAKLKLSPEQPLMMLPDASARVAGGEGAYRLHAVVDDPAASKPGGSCMSQEIIPSSGTGEMKGLSLPVAFDDFTQVVIPWHQPTGSTVETILKGARGDVSTVGQLRKLGSASVPEEGGKLITLAQADSIKNGLSTHKPRAALSLRSFRDRRRRSRAFSSRSSSMR